MNTALSQQSARLYSRLKQGLEAAPRHLRAPEGPMRTLCVAVAAGLLSICIVFSLALLFRIAVLTAYFWALPGLLQWLNVSNLRSRLERTLVRPAQLDKLTMKRFDGNAILAALIPGAIGKRVYHDALFISISAILFTAAAIVLILRTLSGALQDVFWGPWPVDWRLSLALAIALTAAFFICIQRWVEPHRRLQSAVSGSIEAILVPLNEAIASAIAQQEAVDAEIEALENRLGIPHGRGSIENALAGLKAGVDHIFERAQGAYADLENAVHAEVIRKRELQVAFQTYRCACQSIEATASLLTTIPTALTRELQSCRATVDHADVKQLLVTGNWSAYRLILGVVQAHVDILPELAAAMIRPAHITASAQSESETDLEKAFRILRLPPKASPDETRRAYRWLSTMWHPDRRLSSDDAEIKSINWAYAYLRAAEFNAEKAK